MCSFDLTPTDYKFGMRTGKNAELKTLAALDQISTDDAAPGSAHLPAAGLGLSAHDRPGSNIMIYVRPRPMTTIYYLASNAK
jgi:hypothetical protein